MRASPGAILAVLSLAAFMAGLDLFIVNVAFDDIGRDFAGASLSSLSWVLNGYVIVYAHWATEAREGLSVAHPLHSWMNASKRRLGSGDTSHASRPDACTSASLSMSASPIASLVLK